MPQYKTDNITDIYWASNEGFKAGRDPVGKTWETAAEMNYRYQFNDYLALMPDLQWIINPAGAEDAKNALMGSLRLNIRF